MNDCQHQQGEHFLGDCGDTDAMPGPYQWGGKREITPESTHDHLVAWLRLQGAIQ